MPIWRSFFSHPNCRSSWMTFRGTENPTRIRIGLLWMTPIQVNIRHASGWHQVQQKEYHLKYWSDYLSTNQEGKKEHHEHPVCGINMSICWRAQFVFEWYQNFKWIFILYRSAYFSRQEGLFVKSLERFKSWTGLLTHLWIENHPESNLDIDSRCWCTPLEIISKFDRLGARSISMIRSVGGCFCLYRYVFCPRFPQVTRKMINCCAMVCDIDFNHYEREHTQQTGHKKSKAGLSTKFLQKVIANPMPSKLRDNADSMSIAEVYVCVLRASFDRHRLSSP